MLKNVVVCFNLMLALRNGQKAKFESHIRLETDFDLIAEYDYVTSGNFTNLCMEEGNFCQYVLARTWSPQYKPSVEDMTLQSN